MSALPPEADMLIVGINVCYVPEADMLLGAFFDMSPLGGTPLHQGAATLKGLTRSSLVSRVLCF